MRAYTENVTSPATIAYNPMLAVFLLRSLSRLSRASGQVLKIEGRRAGPRRPAAALLRSRKITLTDVLNRIENNSTSPSSGRGSAHPSGREGTRSRRIYHTSSAAAGSKQRSSFRERRVSSSSPAPSCRRSRAPRSAPPPSPGLSDIRSTRSSAGAAHLPDLLRDLLGRCPKGTCSGARFGRVRHSVTARAGLANSALPVYLVQRPRLSLRLHGCPYLPGSTSSLPAHCCATRCTRPASPLRSAAEAAMWLRRRMAPRPADEATGRQ